MIALINWKVIVGVALGAALGFGWYKVVGCRTGTCPITARWWTSTGYGAVMGYLASRS